MDVLENEKTEEVVVELGYVDTDCPHTILEASRESLSLMEEVTDQELYAQPEEEGEEVAAEEEEVKPDLSADI